MRRIICFVVGFAAMFALASTLASADQLEITSSPSPSGRTWNVDGTTLSSDEMLHLFDGFRKALDKNDTSIHVVLQTKKASDMPAYAPQWYCSEATLQSDGTPKLTIWILDGAGLTTAKTGIEACIFAGLAETGYGGPKWKALYDGFAAEDAALGQSAANPIVNRQRFALQLSQFYEAVSSGKLTPTPSPSP